MSGYWDMGGSYGMSGEFSQDLNKELHRLLARFKNETEIIKITEPRQDRVYEKLVWLNE